MKRFLTNFPIPVPFLITLISGHAIQKYWITWKISAALVEEIGTALIIGSLSIIIWAVIASLDVDIENANALVIGGPYRFSRNPMYVGWGLLHLGVSFASNNLWILFLTIPAFLAIHYLDVLNEEKLLHRKFGSDYEEYKSRTKRYM